MSYDAVPPEVLRQITPQRVCSHAQDHGWHRAPVKRPGIEVYRRDEPGPTELVVPTDRSFVDFERSMLRALIALSEAEQQAPISVARDIIAAESDVLRFAVRNASDDGTIALNDAIDLVDGARRTLLAAACDVVDPRPYHPSLGLAQATAFLDAVRFGHTEWGSFVATVQCPLRAGAPFGDGLQPPLAEVPCEDPFARRVTRHLADSVAALATSAEYGPSENEQPTSVSANLCESLVRMRPSGSDTSLSLGVRWASLRPGERVAPSHTVVGWREFAAIEAMAASLRPGRAVDVEGPFVGKIRSLQRDEPTQGTLLETAKLKFEFDGRVVTASLELTPAQHACACDAYKADRYVRVVGRLHRRSSRTYAIEPVDQIDQLY